MPFAGKPFPNEPEGAEAAIFWHLQQIDHHENQATTAEACDYSESVKHHDDIGKQHKQRLAWLEDMFPMAAKDARESLQRFYDKRSYDISIKHPDEPKTPFDAILFYLERISIFEKKSSLDHYQQHCLNDSRARLEQLETEFPAASVAARLKIALK